MLIPKGWAKVSKTMAMVPFVIGIIVGSLWTAGGALSEYLYRGRRYRAALESSCEGQLLEVNPKPVRTKP